MQKYYPKNQENLAQYKRNWYEKNKERILAKRKKNYYCNKSVILLKHKEYTARNKDRIRVRKNAYNHQRRLGNPLVRVNNSISAQIRNCLKGNKSGRSWEKLVGYGLEDLKKHLESKFEPGMSWGNFGKWEIDHITPKSWYAFSSPDDDSFKQCWGLENLQPLWKYQNVKKGHRYAGSPVGLIWLREKENGRLDKFKLELFTQRMPTPSKDELKELYQIQKFSAKEIGQMFGVTKVAVAYWLRKLGIQVRSTSEANKAHYKRHPEAIERLRQNVAFLDTIRPLSHNRHRKVAVIELRK